MRYLQYLNLVGQLCEIIGAYLLFRYSIPPHINKLSGAWAYSSPDSAPDVSKELSDNKRYETLTKRGFLLILIGFFLSFSFAIYNAIDNNTKDCQKNNCHHTMIQK